MMGIPYMGNMVFILRRGPGYQGCQGCSGPGLLGGNKGRWGRQGYAVIFHHSGKDIWASLRIMHIKRLFSTLYTQETHQSLRVDTDHRAHNFDSTSLAHTHTDTHTYIYIYIYIYTTFLFHIDNVFFIPCDTETGRMIAPKLPNLSIAFHTRFFIF